MNELYNTLLDEKYSKYPYEKSDLKEGMVLVNEVMYQYWKPRYLVDNNTKQAYMFLDGRETLCTITKDDIDFESLRCISRGGGARAYCLDAQYPTQIRNYENGVAEVAWQVTPDGRYFMDEDGFGMTNDEEETLYGFIDHEGKAVGKFRFINDDWNKLRQMRQEAEMVVKQSSQPKL